MSSIGELRAVARQSGSARREKGLPFRKRFPDAVQGYLFLAPWLVGLVAFTVGPMIVSFYLSLTDYHLLRNARTAPAFIGLENYTRMFEDPRLLKSLEVTVVYVVTSVPLQLALALAVALLLDKGMRGLPLYRSVFYLPSLFGGSVAVAILWRQVFGQTGLVNQLLALFGIEGPGWISHPDTALSTIVILHVWTFGSPMVIFLAGLRQIPGDLYEAAQMDGASPVRRFRSITVPLLTPILFFNLVLQTIFAFQSFTQAFIVSGGTGGPVDSTLFYSLYLYQTGFTKFQMGYASAMAWFLLVVIGLVTAVNFWLSKYWVFYED
ncbi:carbohydrate ABC transporter permease [Antribacter gilvus]|uniref:carbohydrate ABC transporter permease n=1 Tax=Antribacter gilvus TaxID=2304675 RepID=UPI0013DFB37E|nr:sugar ABC transporter permease [Antribacter gilvus]